MTLFVEGGGPTRALQAPARMAFRALLEKLGLKGSLPKVVACGGRGQALNDFGIAIRRGDAAVVLVDSEEPVAPGLSAAQHLRKRNEWSHEGNDRRIHLMVQVMESWFLTQPQIAAMHLGKNFDISALPRAVSIEAVEKETVLDAFDKACRECKGGPYRKRKRDGFEILGGLSVEPIENSSGFARVFFDYLRQNCL